MESIRTLNLNFVGQACDRSSELSIMDHSLIEKMRRSSLLIKYDPEKKKQKKGERKCMAVQTEWPQNESLFQSFKTLSESSN